MGYFKVDTQLMIVRKMTSLFTKAISNFVIGVGWCKFRDRSCLVHFKIQLQMFSSKFFKSYNRKLLACLLNKVILLLYLFNFCYSDPIDTSSRFNSS